MSSEEAHPVRFQPTGSAYAMWVGLTCALLGGLTLGGWYGHYRPLQTFGPWTVAMRPLGALALALAGFSLAARAVVRARRASVATAGVAAALGLLALIDHVRPGLRIGPTLVLHVLHIGGLKTVTPMAPATAVCLMVAGLGIVIAWRKPRSRLTSACAFVAAVPPAVILVAYIYDLRLTAPSDLNRMSLPMAIALLLMTSALWWLRGPDSALRILVTPSAGGTAVRRLVPVGILVPLVLGWPRIVSLRHELFGPVVSTAIGQVEASLLFAMAVFWAAVSIDRMEGRRREAAALSERREVQLANAQRIAQVGSWERDLASGHTEWSEELHRLLGYTIGSVTPSLSAFLDRVVPRDRDRVADEIERAARGGEPLQVEFSVELPNGTKRTLEGHGSVQSAEGGTARFVGVSRDVTERRRIEKALRESEDRYRIIIEEAAEGIWVSDAHGKTSLVNPRMAQMLGYSVEELSSLPLATFLRDDGAALLRRVNARRRAGLVDRYEVELIRKDGTSMWVAVAANPLLSSSGEFLGSLAMISDISMRKEAQVALEDALEREREAVERLRSIDDMKDAFLAAVSHELRTPLTGVLGFAATLQQREGSLSEEERTAITDRLVRNAERLQHLLSDLLDLDRLKRGLITPHRRRVKIDELVRGVAEHVDLGRHLLTIDIDPELEAFLDGPKVERIIENLLNNAIRHTDPSSRIWLSATSSDGGFVLSVDDDGPGVDDRSKTKIFQPFQTGSDRNRHSPGTGIGLSLVTRFAELHGGRSWIDDRPGGGSSFKVYLPRGESDGAHLDSGAA